VRRERERERDRDRQREDTTRERNGEDNECGSVGGKNKQTNIFRQKPHIYTHSGIVYNI
jgi:hypothetical protein